MNSNDTQASGIDSPKFARCSIGKGKWFWVTCRNMEDWCDRKFIVTGIAATPDEAEAAAKASIAAALGNVVPQQWGSKHALEVNHWEAVKRRAARATKAAKDAAGVEYVYTDWESDYDSSCGSSPHRIVKKTARRVYVEDRNSSWTENGDVFADVETFVLDRKKLESTGEASNPRFRYETFYTTTYEERHKAFPHGCLHFLGAEIEATEEAVNATYRSLAKERHPDHGGNAEDFKELQRAYENAMKVVQR